MMFHRGGLLHHARPGWGDSEDRRRRSCMGLRSLVPKRGNAMKRIAEVSKNRRRARYLAAGILLASVFGVGSLLQGKSSTQPAMCGSTPCPDWDAIAAKERARVGAEQPEVLPPCTRAQRTSCVVARDPVVQAERDGATRGRFSTNNFGTTRQQPSADYRYHEQNQRMQTRVDSQDSRAMRQMEKDARFRNRVNEYNFRHGGR